jgi:hypothetical protein
LEKKQKACWIVYAKYNCNLEFKRGHKVSAHRSGPRLQYGACGEADSAHSQPQLSMLKGLTTEQQCKNSMQEDEQLLRKAQPKSVM